MMQLCHPWRSLLVIVLLELARSNVWWKDIGGFPSAHALSSPSPLPPFQDQRIDFPHGISAQVLSGIPPTNNKRKNLPVLVFLHGSFHAAWCWEEKYFPYFVSLGYPVVALSWRGTSGTPAGEGIKKVKASEHCQDLQAFLDQLPDIVGSNDSSSNDNNDDDEKRCKPILISHSFGGIVLMKYLEQCLKKPSELFSGLIFMCSVPPSGNGKLTLRYLKRSLRDSWKITAGFAMKKCLRDATLTRELFFGGVPQVVEEEDGTTTIIDDYGVSDEDLEMYQQRFAMDTTATIDLLDLGKQLPSRQTDDDGKAPFVNDLPPCLVIAAKNDFIVDEIANIETAKYFGISNGPVIIDSPHDVMLGRTWKNGANAIQEWIQSTILQ